MEIVYKKWRKVYLLDDKHKLSMIELPEIKNLGLVMDLFIDIDNNKYLVYDYYSRTALYMYDLDGKLLNKIVTNFENVKYDEDEKIIQVITKDKLILYNYADFTLIDEISL